MASFYSWTPCIIKILNIYIMLSCTHLYHTSFRYLSNIALDKQGCLDCTECSMDAFMMECGYGTIICYAKIVKTFLININYFGKRQIIKNIFNFKSHFCWKVLWIEIIKADAPIFIPKSNSKKFCLTLCTIGLTLCNGPQVGVI